MFARKTKSTTKNELLYPKDTGLKGDNKPSVLIIRMMHDEDRTDNAVNYSPTKQLATDRGYTVVNTCEIIFDEKDGKLYEKGRKGRLNEIDESEVLNPYFRNQDKPLIVWVEAHGAPSWLFGAEKSFRSEAEGTMHFKKCISRIEDKNNISISNIILNACYSGAEIYCPNNNSFINSPARLLSILVPKKNVLGFIGVTSGAKVRGFVNANNKPQIIALEDASILFQDGAAIDYKKGLDLHSNPEFIHMPDFVKAACEIPKDSNEHFLVCAAREHAAKINHGTENNCYAAKQLREYEKQADKDKDNQTAPTPKT